MRNGSTPETLCVTQRAVLKLHVHLSRLIYFDYQCEGNWGRWEVRKEMEWVSGRAAGSQILTHCKKSCSLQATKWMTCRYYGIQFYSAKEESSNLGSSCVWNKTLYQVKFTSVCYRKDWFNLLKKKKWLYLSKWYSRVLNILEALMIWYRKSLWAHRICWAI